MSAIIPFLDGHSFDPDHVLAMGRAFDIACVATLQNEKTRVTRETIAKCIIEIAKSGERDAAQLSARALKALGVQGVGRAI